MKDELTIIIDKIKSDLEEIAETLKASRDANQEMIDSISEITKDLKNEQI